MKAGLSKPIQFLTDALGSVRDIVRGTDGVVVQSYDYDPWGNHLPTSGLGSVDSQKTFVGGLSVQDETEDTGLHLMGMRWYDPSVGRFLSRDPIGFAGGLNLFQYAASSPLTHTDSRGLDIWSDLVEATGTSLEYIGIATTGLGAAAEVGGPRMMYAGANVARTGVGAEPGFQIMIGGVLVTVSGKVLLVGGGAITGLGTYIKSQADDCGGNSFGDFGDYVVPKNNINVRIPKRNVYNKTNIGQGRRGNPKGRVIDIMDALEERFPQTKNFPEFWKKMKGQVRGFDKKKELHWFEHPLLEKWFDPKLVDQAKRGR